MPEATRLYRTQVLQRHPVSMGSNQYIYIQRVLPSMQLVHSSLTKLPTMGGAPRALNEGTCSETEDTRATPQNAPTKDQKAMMILPSALGDSFLYPKKCATGAGTACHRGAGTIRLRNLSMSRSQVLVRASHPASLEDLAMIQASSWRRTEVCTRLCVQPDQSCSVLRLRHPGIDNISKQHKTAIVGVKTLMGESCVNLYPFSADLSAHGR